MAGAVDLLLLLVLAVPAAYATNYRVGDNSGWDTGIDYTSWASGKTFIVGDTLQFVYGSLHRVDEVNKDGYDNCSASNAISSASDGNTTITLNSTGTHYYICPILNHCSSLGMKLAVTVSSSGVPSTPRGSPPSTPPTSPSTPTTNKNNSGGMSGSFSEMNALVLGASLVLAPLLL